MLAELYDGQGAGHGCRPFILLTLCRLNATILAGPRCEERSRKVVDSTYPVRANTAPVSEEHGLQLGAVLQPRINYTVNGAMELCHQHTPGTVCRSVCCSRNTVARLGRGLAEFHRKLQKPTRYCGRHNLMLGTSIISLEEGPRLRVSLHNQNHWRIFSFHVICVPEELRQHRSSS